MKKCNMAFPMLAMALAAAQAASGDMEDMRVAALDKDLWKQSEWISVADAPVAGDAVRRSQRAADGASWFVASVTNEGVVAKAEWMTTGLGVYELYVNGSRVGNGDQVLKPGFTHPKKTRRSFTYDVTSGLEAGKGAVNFFAAEVTSGWWSDKIVNYAGRKNAFRAVLKLTYKDGSVKVFGTNTKDWRAGVGGPVRHAAIFDGEEYDARVAAPTMGEASFKAPEVNDEFQGEILPTDGAEICLRQDLMMMKPEKAYVWKGVDGADAAKGVFGRVHKLRDVDFTKVFENGMEGGKSRGEALKKGETLVVDFGQNCAAVPLFLFKAAEGTVLTCLPAEMLNDSNGEKSRGNDGPGGSVYRANLRVPDRGMRLVYTFGKGEADGNGVSSYVPRHTFFGYRYISVTATDDVEFFMVMSVPVTSIAEDMEIGEIETGVEDLNRLVKNIYWGQLSNYLSVPTDCPQRNERLGWMADTQVFCEAGSFNADTSAFFHKFMRDVRDSQDSRGGFPGVSPRAQYGNEYMRLGWSDAGVIVPYQVWKQFGDRGIVAENWEAMERYVARVNETKYDYEQTKGENRGYQWADWLSYERLESCGGGIRNNGKLRPEAKFYWNYLGACYWLWDAMMMQEMAAAIGGDGAKYVAMAKDAREYLRKNFFAADGMVSDTLRGMQTPALFALRLGLVDGDAKRRTIEELKRNFKDHGDCLQTGFLGTSILMETLSANGMTDIAYTLLLQHKNPSWLYSVDQGATTIWERWNSYTKEKGFGPVGMNSFNHYAYGAVLAWMYKDMAGIAADPKAPGFSNIVMAPKPDRRVGFVKAQYNSTFGLVKSAWRYEGEKWIWEFTVPAKSTADVYAPGATAPRRYVGGDYRIEMKLP